MRPAMAIKPTFSRVAATLPIPTIRLGQASHECDQLQLISWLLAKSWQHYVLGVCLLQQWTISPTDLQHGHRLLCEFTQEFEWLYYEQHPDCIHFVWQSIHLLTHIASETICIGPLSCYSQWTIETAIGNLGVEIHQDRDPYANIAQWGILCAQLNSILAMFPHLKLHKDLMDSFPWGAKDLGQGYALLRACQKTAKPVKEAEASAILRYWEENGWPNLDDWPQEIKQWAHFHLPNGQTACSKWYESQSFPGTCRLRKTTCVKVHSYSVSCWFS